MRMKEAVKMTQLNKRKARKATNLTLNAELVRQANSLNINMSQAAEDGIRAAIKQQMDTNWRAENQAAIEQYNATVDATDLPFAKYRSL